MRILSPNKIAASDSFAADELGVKLLKIPSQIFSKINYNKDFYTEGEERIHRETQRRNLIFNLVFHKISIFFILN